MSAGSVSNSSLSSGIIIGESDLEEGEVICSKCNGKRRIITDKPKWWQLRLTEIESLCPKCFGDGKLDWIENAVGKKRPYWTHGSGSSISSSSLSSSSQPVPVHRNK